MLCYALFLVCGVFCLQRKMHKMGIEQFGHLCCLLLMAFPKTISILPCSSSLDIFKYILCTTFDIFFKMFDPSLSGFRPVQLSSKKSSHTFVLVFTFVSLFSFISRPCGIRIYQRSTFKDIVISIVPPSPCLS